MKQPITGYHKDEQQDWVGELACGHFRHVRHRPPFFNRPWVESQSGRDSMLGVELECKKCDDGAPRDDRGGAARETGERIRQSLLR